MRSPSGSAPRVVEINGDRSSWLPGMPGDSGGTAPDSHRLPPRRRRSIHLFGYTLSDARGRWSVTPLTIPGRGLSM
ncbi:hypothetical protein GCM10010168_65350 [Actinoplanes ianthinogenes]|uniref:Uncharacterized protein n=1 Tax=Actinoplanes ianthinogenes TaxID=122358 RepID=A0ABM7LS20_9ACTN|nr:hypothetical protein Aiant_27440 [Actinoplanes ianthinogenes]GGR37765.1 hypothetical protein GCM10010168_65350 [Actinoplanes ianthinogenes]